MDWLSDEVVTTLIIAILGAAWAAFKGSEFYAAKLNWKHKLLATIIEAAAEKTYKQYVRPLKQRAAVETPPGEPKLSEAEREKAMRLTTDKVRYAAHKAGLDGLTELEDKDLLESSIESAIRRAKAGQ